MSQMSVTEAVTNRRAVRAFTDRPVAEALIKELLGTAGHAPSGSNIQPWNVHVFTGEALQAALQSIQGRLYSGEMEVPEFPTYPEPLGEPYRERRATCGERMYTALGIPREDKGARIQQVMRNYQFFGAPVGIIITMDNSMGESQALDIGIFAQTLMLVAKERGLDTCPQVSWTLWPKAVKEAMSIPAAEKIMVGISLGYGEPENPVNYLNHPRADLEDFVQIKGF
ncbi:nitroreductase [Seongchinamella sediminis]|uniref:Nitroreductase n=1 Tax=Seongchinamella sediminis TaxID=2283635 RepID=A0A3L7DWK7_9GAMM|nr:nitroreductase [Seongchinamella sediminis]RLQ20182.1 nitroreductase [Seongchinamella sediminis]